MSVSCADFQSQFSLYLYGELDFAAEEALELHLPGCPACELALSREKLWHASLKDHRAAASGNLLADCRRDLMESVRCEATSLASLAPTSRSWHLPDWLRLNFTHLSRRFALASFFLFAGMVLARWTEGFRLPMSASGDPTAEMGVLGSQKTRIRDIQPGDNGQVRIVIDRLQEQELIGTPADSDIRVLLLSAAQNSVDPSLRIDSFELLRQQRGEDIRDVLLSAVRNDKNAAVRMKALDALRSFPPDDATRQALVHVLEHDTDTGVRMEAINVLAPPDSGSRYLAPELLRALRGLTVAGHEDDYIRARSIQILRSVGDQPGQVY